MSGFPTTFLPLLALVGLWTVVLKGYSLWYAGRAGQTWWFVALLVINTFGILEIIYLIWFRPTTHTKVSAAVAPAPAPVAETPARESLEQE